ncbi:Thioredoxin reductase [Pseudozyma hubeiensis]|nr:Thioredoxin reductase [Pseudozyma hubeiensis]
MLEFTVVLALLPWVTLFSGGCRLVLPAIRTSPQGKEKREAAKAEKIHSLPFRPTGNIHARHAIPFRLRLYIVFALHCIYHYHLFAYKSLRFIRILSLQLASSKYLYELGPIIVALGFVHLQQPLPLDRSHQQQTRHQTGPFLLFDLFSQHLLFLDSSLPSHWSTHSTFCRIDPTLFVRRNHFFFI